MIKNIERLAYCKSLKSVKQEEIDSKTLKRVSYVTAGLIGFVTLGTFFLNSDMYRDIVNSLNYDSGKEVIIIDEPIKGLEKAINSLTNN